jgi:hypothetical protein
MSPTRTSAERDLSETFATLRDVLAAQSGDLVVTVDRPGDFQVASPAMQDRIGRPLSVAGVRTRKHYVSYFLMPVYAAPRLVRSLSPGLKKRMHGLSCFNFTTIDPDQIDELSKLTKTGIGAFKDVPLPWASDSEDTARRKTSGNTNRRSRHRRG